MTNYFELYGLQVQFGLDAGQVKRQYLLKSKASHPDFFAQASAKEQDDAMNLTADNNAAYKVLSDKELRTQHILEIFGMINKEEKAVLAPSFLMEMMDINEQLMDAGVNPTLQQKINQQVDELLNQLNNQETPLMKAFDQEKNQEALKKIKDIYFQRKYLLRIKEKIDTFASP